jgi:acetyl-CoA C-acetyltransferase
MPEAVIVAGVRSPIGRAVKGSLASMRPDDLAAQMVRAALAEVPQFDPAEVDDLILGCGLPGGEQGFNIARTAAVQLGYDTMSGTTATRMAMHATPAGEGDVFVSAGVETVSRYSRGNSDSLPGTENPLFGAAGHRTDELSATNAARSERSAPSPTGTSPGRSHR